MDYVPLHTREQDMLILMVLRDLPQDIVRHEILPRIRGAQRAPQAPAAPRKRLRPLVKRMLNKGRKILDFN
mgnify:CR=1 FL=1